MTDLAPGLEHTHRFVVDDRLSTTVGGNLPVAVLSTPGMIGMMEWASSLAVQDALPPGKATVGFEVCIKHVGAVGEGAPCSARARLDEIVDERKFRFTVEVTSDDDGRTLGVGTHERRLVDIPSG